ncbi:MAG: PLD nuclease N-terminal domain-containing protein [Clostridiaceae bacterium]|nr:PLD nuclease N-terminal domain-containing protein [Clostridiaceae bacterium]MBW4859503.1 PLD nuclease N-terminal domain-containing protein [Clostridiaceae bacterium]MBW4867348.1 PLD nuclease N-terminal domain-containing protein [Clostridiaceae bacterium]
MRQKWLSTLIHRRILVFLLLVVQFFVIIYLVFNGSKKSIFISWGLKAISLFVTLYIINKKEKGAYKLTWVFLILISPTFSGLFYLLFNFQSSIKHTSTTLERIENESKPLFTMPVNIFKYACNEALEYIPQIQYLQNFAGFPIYNHTRTEYLSS